MIKGNQYLFKSIAIRKANISIFMLMLVLFMILTYFTPKPAVADNDYYVPSDYPTIQSAINAAFAAGGGIVHVSAGTYYENIFLMNGVILNGEGDNVTTISGNGQGSSGHCH